MADVHWKPGNMLYPLPVVMVSCGDEPSNYNIITVAWAGTICSDPPMVSISIRPSRLSHEIISRTKEFVINICTQSLTEATDWCGCKSGRDVNKWKELGLRPIASQTVAAPSIAQCPLSIECKVENIVPLGTHDMFVARVTNVRVDDKYVNPETGALELESARPICYSHGQYYVLGRRLGKFGFSVEKKRRRRS